MLNMAEKIVLLSLENESGRTLGKATFLRRYGLSAALLYELIIMNRVAIQGKKISIIDESSTGNAVLDMAFDIIKKAKTLNKWIFSFVISKANIRKQIIYSFIDKGIVKNEEKRFLGFIPLKRYPVTNDLDKNNTVQKIKEVLLDGKNDDDCLIFFSSIIVACNAQSLILSKEEMKNIKDKLKLIAKGKYFSTKDDFLFKTVKSIRNAIASESST